MTERKSLSLRKFEAHKCVCGDTRGEHVRRTEIGGPKPCTVCADCADFERKLPSRRALRNTAASGRKYENEIAELFGGVRRGGVGEADVLVMGADNLPVINIECENAKSAATSKRALGKLREAQRHGSTMTGRPIPVHVYRQKPKPGQPKGEDYALMLASDLAELLRRLGVDAA